MRIAVWGAGAVGARAARQLASRAEVTGIVVHDRDRARAAAVSASLGAIAGVGEAEPAGVAAVVLAMPAGGHRAAAERCLEAGVDVVSVADSVDDVRELLALDAEATERGRHVVVGAAFAPGLTCVLAAHAAGRLETVDEIHVSRVGTGGPACARRHHRSLRGHALDWRDGAWVERRGGTGRELSWFPDPIGGEDCYRAALPDGLLLVGAFPGVGRVTARLAANRRDRFTSRLPMLRPPHAEGGPGAVRVEVRGSRGAARDVVVLGAMDRPAVAAGAVAAQAAAWAGAGRLRRPGAAGLAALVDPAAFLAELARVGVRAAVFEGAASTT